MGWFDYFSDLASAITIQDSAADAQQSRGSSEDAPTSGGASTKSPASGTDEESEEEAEVNKEDAKEDDGEEAQGQEPSGDDDEGGEEEEEEEEEEDEPEDIKEKLEEECMKTAACAPLKHHYDECAERVQKQIDDNGKAEEDCVEEFFHMMHCASQCAAPKLFKALR